MDRPGLLRRITMYALRWVLLTGVIGGVLAMHVLGGHVPGGRDAVSMPGMSMPAVQASSLPADMPGDMRVVTTPPVKTLAIPTPAVATTAVRVVDGAMSDMSCCVLFLAMSGLLVLTILWSRAVGFDDAQTGGPSPARFRRSRGGPGVGPPRISLCVVRV